jgi:hypothetical protein
MVLILMCNQHVLFWLLNCLRDSTYHFTVLSCSTGHHRRRQGRETPSLTVAGKYPPPLLCQDAAAELLMLQRTTLHLGNEWHIGKPISSFCCCVQCNLIFVCVCPRLRASIWYLISSELVRGRGNECYVLRGGLRKRGVAGASWLLGYPGPGGEWDWGIEAEMSRYLVSLVVVCFIRGFLIGLSWAENEQAGCEPKWLRKACECYMQPILKIRLDWVHTIQRHNKPNLQR